MMYHLVLLMIPVVFGVIAQMVLTRVGLPVVLAWTIIITGGMTAIPAYIGLW